MHIPGHMAVVLTQHTLPPFSMRKKALLPLLAAALLPDAVDKTIGYALNVMPNGRHFAHNIFSFVGSSLLVRLFWGKSIGLAWFMGYLGHLLADNPKRVPWLFPVKKYQFKQQKFRFGWGRFFREGVVLALVLFIYTYKRRRASTTFGNCSIIASTLES